MGIRRAFRARPALSTPWSSEAVPKHDRQAVQFHRHPPGAPRFAKQQNVTPFTQAILVQAPRSGRPPLLAPGTFTSSAMTGIDAGVPAALAGDGGACAATGPAAAAFAALGALGAARAVEVEHLEDRQRALLQQKKTLAREIKVKKQRDQRLLSKAVKNLSETQLIQAAALKAAATTKAKAKTATKAAAKAKATAAAAAAAPPPGVADDHQDL